MKKPRRYKYKQPTLLTDILQQQAAAQHLQERRQLQKKFVHQDVEAELLNPLYWNPETESYEKLVWAKERKEWVKPE